MINTRINCVSHTHNWKPPFAPHFIMLIWTQTKLYLKRYFKCVIFPFSLHQEWLTKGHGEYREIPSERDFFQEVKESKKVVCHFYRDSTFR